MGYKTIPRSKARIRAFADKVRDIFGFSLEEKIPVMKIFETMCSGLNEGDFEYEIVPIMEMPDKYAETIPEKRLVRIREETYYGACNGNPRDLFTVSHEIGHILLHSNSTISFARSDEQIKTYEDPEWQANTFAGEFMAPSSVCKNMDIDLIVNRYGCSKTVAEIQSRG